MRGCESFVPGCRMQVIVTMTFKNSKIQIELTEVFKCTHNACTFINPTGGRLGAYRLHRNRSYRMTRQNKHWFTRLAGDLFVDFLFLFLSWFVLDSLLLCVCFFIYISRDSIMIRVVVVGKSRNINIFQHLINKPILPSPHHFRSGKRSHHACIKIIAAPLSGVCLFPATGN